MRSLTLTWGRCRSPTVRTALIAGPSGTGKTKLIHALASEASAVFLDLSPRSTDGKFPGCVISRSGIDRACLVSLRSVADLILKISASDHGSLTEVLTMMQESSNYYGEDGHALRQRICAVRHLYWRMREGENFFLKQCARGGSVYNGTAHTMSIFLSVMYAIRSELHMTHKAFTHMCSAAIANLGS